MRRHRSGPSLESPEVGAKYRTLDRWLLESEAAIRLLERCCPLNLIEERGRVERAWQTGERTEPRFRYAPPPDFGALRRSLDRLAETLEQGDPLDHLYSLRTRELGIEAFLGEAVGGPELRRRAERRFSSAMDHDHACLAESWAQAWTGAPAELAAWGLIPSDDEHNSASLVSSLRRALGRQRLPYRVEVRSNLMSAAATGPGVISVRAAAAHTPGEVACIVTHEIKGHAWPRYRAQAQTLGLCRIGTAGAADDEEGRALLLEERHGLASRARRAELGWRHLAALAVLRGADFVETVEHVRRRGAPLRMALELAIRCLRGGGLGREIVYLPARTRLLAEFARDPELECWLEHGRVSVDAARALSALGERPRRRPAGRSAPGVDHEWASYS